MAACWLSSSHRKWIFSRDQLAKRIERNGDAGSRTVALLPRIAEIVPCVSSRVVYTASVLFKRFVISCDDCGPNALCALLACVFIVLKNEECDECPRLKTFVKQCAAAHEKLNLPVFQAKEILEIEKRVLAVLNFEIMVHSAHVFLEIVAVDVALSDENFGKAHALLMTSLNTNVHLLFTPHLVAVSCVFLSAFRSQPDVVDALFSRLHLPRKLLDDFICELRNQ
jgi:hypothetical protein